MVHSQIVDGGAPVLRPWLDQLIEIDRRTIGAVLPVPAQPDAAPLNRSPAMQLAPLIFPQPLPPIGIDAQAEHVAIEFQRAVHVGYADGDMRDCQNGHRSMPDSA